MKKNIIVLMAICLIALSSCAMADDVGEAIDSDSGVYTYQSSDESVATVDIFGVVTPISPGVVVISAYQDDVLVDEVEIEITGDCPWCGGNMLDGSTDHTTKWSAYDPDDHFRCAIEHLHHCESCGLDFPCSLWNSHTPCDVCDKPWCDKSTGNHTLCPLCEQSRLCVGNHGRGICVSDTDCPFSTHYIGDGLGPHRRCEYCDKWLCNGENHEVRVCGDHCRAQLKKKDHTRGECYIRGHYNCDGRDHSELACGHYACQRGNHSLALCGISGHYVCDGGDHSELVCGHYMCQGGNHNQAVCNLAGHYVCDGRDHAQLPCGHYACQDGNHTQAICGVSEHYVCDGRDHSQLPCGHYACQDGNHTQAICGVSGHYACDGRDHAQLPCGHYACQEGNHALGECEIHYLCDGREHMICDYCYGFVCDGGEHDIGLCAVGD
ncbi:MAG: hypothetical protein Q4D04_12610 [Clostridia bacterium]|nr:hypothetical protein [Clostridia bacterium]